MKLPFLCPLQTGMAGADHVICDSRAVPRSFDAFSAHRELRDASDVRCLRKLRDLGSTPPQPDQRTAGQRCRRWALIALSLLGAWAPFAAAQPTPAVGMTQLMAGELPFTLVYPTLAATSSLSRGPFTLQVAQGAAPLAGPRRLVVLSHGTGGSATADHSLAATLVRAGFVVAQPQHAGDNFQDTSRAGPSAWKTRPAEVTQVIDALAAHPFWKDQLRLDKVGVHGMSAGGVTALALAGGQWRVLNLVQHCLAHPDADAGFCFNGAAAPAARAIRQASFERVRGVPEVALPAEFQAVHGGLTPAPAAGRSDVRPDPRVAAITLAVPVAAIFSADSLARIRVPVGLISASHDTVLLPTFHSDHLMKHCSSCVRLTDLKGAGHFDLVWPWPAAVAQAVAATQVRGGSPEPGFEAQARDAAFERVARFHVRELTP